jgi:hypothetical protein
MEQILSNPAFGPFITSLGFGGIVLILFLTGKLPTPAERKQYEDRLTIQSKEHQLELDTVRTNLRKDLDEAQSQILQKDTYIKELVKGVMAQQETIQSTNLTLSSLAQQLPVLVYAVQELVSQNKKA